MCYTKHRGIERRVVNGNPKPHNSAINCHPKPHDNGIFQDSRLRESLEVMKEILANKRLSHLETR